MSGLSITSLEPVTIREWERRPDLGALYCIDRDGDAERLTRRWDRGSQAIGMVMVIGIIALIAFGLGVVHGRLNPRPSAPVAAGRL